MLTIQTGLTRDKRETTLVNSIKKLSASYAGRIFLLVPEQSTFLYTRSVCAALGNSLSNNRVSVVGFDELFDLIHTECGHRAEMLDEGGRLLALAFAADNATKAHALKVYSGLSARPEFLEKLLDNYSMLRQSGMNVDQIEEITEKVSPVLRSKLEDMAVLYGEYEAICQKSALDPAEHIENIAEIIEKTQWAKNTAWFVDGFSDFPHQQMRLIHLLIQQADHIHFAFDINGIGDEQSGRISANHTAQSIIDFAKAAGFDYDIFNSGNDSAEHPALSYLQNHLCDETPAADSTISDADKVVRLFCDPSPYQECQHIAGTILRAVRNGYRYKDISIVLPDYERYEPILASVCRRYDIPVYFASRKDEIAKKPLMLAIFSALNCATRGMQKEDTLNYIKSGLSGLDSREVDRLEEYVRTWNIHGKGWITDEKGWALHPRGYGYDFTEADVESLAELNRIRVKCATPLLNLQQNLKNSKNVAEQVEAFYEFLEEIQFVDRLQSIVDDMQQQGKDQIAAEYAQISSVLNDAVEQMHEVAASMERSPSEFSKLFRLMLSTYRIATIPVSVDQINVLNLGDARYFQSKIRYIVGAEEGVFPAYIAPSGLLGDAEINELSAAADVYLPGTSDDIAKRSLSEINTVVAGAQKMLVFSYASDPATPATPSHLYTRVNMMFPELTPTRGCGKNGIYEADLLSAEMTGRLMGRVYNRKGYDNIITSIALIDNPDLQTAALRVTDKADWKLQDLSKHSVRGLFGERVNLTATRCNVYSSCRYHYFLKYGLLLKEPPRSKLNEPFFGDFMHKILETTIREVEAKGGFKKISDEQLLAITNKHIDDYTVKEMHGIEQAPERFVYLYKRQAREILNYIMGTEAPRKRTSDFISTGFECRIGGEGADFPAITVDCGKTKGVYTGIIDRVDACNIDGKDYFQISDYKSGRSKSIDFADIQNGIDMQPVLYMMGAVNASEHGGNDIVTGGSLPAGALYSPAKFPLVAAQTRLSDEKIEIERTKMLMRRGVLLNDPKVLEATEHSDEDGKRKYLNVKVSKDGSVSGDVCTAEQLDTLNQFSVHKLRDIVENIATGKVAANPISRGPERNACRYCPLKGACHKDCCGTKFRYIAKVSEEDFWNQITKEVSKRK